MKETIWTLLVIVWVCSIWTVVILNNWITVNRDSGAPLLILAPALLTVIFISIVATFIYDNWKD